MTATNRYRISSNFLGVKIFLIICWLFIPITIITSDKVDPEMHLTFVLFTVIAAATFYYIQTRKLIEFDGTDKLYVYDNRRQEMFEIPLENIVKFRYSIVFTSYKISYRNENNEIEMVRLFLRPMLFRNDITKLIAITKTKNPNVEVINMTFGLDEFFD